MVEYIVFFGLFLSGFIFLGLDMRRSKGVHVQQYIPPYFEELDKCESPIEKRVLKALWMRDYKAIAQYPMSPYRLDLALPEYRIALNVTVKHIIHLLNKKHTTDKWINTLDQKGGQRCGLVVKISMEI